ncbi:MAG: O-antigen ligase family protein [Mucilaginibacter sp.]
MLIKKIIVFSAVAFYLYTLTLNLFLTVYFPIPSPVIFGACLVPFVQTPLVKFTYLKEVVLLGISLFLYYVIGMNDGKTFFVTFIVIVACACYFNYLVGLNTLRFNLSVIVFYSVLLISMVIMSLDHGYQDMIDPLRTTLLGDQIKQSPSGLAFTQFTFGYQVAAFSVFIFVLVCVYKRAIFIRVLVLFVCLAVIYLGMNRSAFVAFVGTVVLFLFIYYRYKAMFLVAASVLIGFAVYFYILKDNTDDKNNILSKNIAKEDVEVDRAEMASENLKIYADYPLGLIFYGKTWEEVSYRNPAFPLGLSSHNAYLMFITYLGPFLAIGLLFGIYSRISKLFWLTIKHIRFKQRSLFLALLFSFLAVSANALFHNAWLVTADGPTLFLFFAIMQAAKIYGLSEKPEIDDIAIAN